MAERRMISKNIIDSDAFLDMPASSQNLYFHLNIRADDEGFIDGPKKVMRTIGANQNDLEILLAKRYLLSFDSGVIVIKHWKLHNLIRKDRMKDTMYTEEKGQLFHKKDGSYTDHGNQMSTKSQRSIVEVSIEEDSKDKTKTAKPKKHKYGEYSNILLSDKEALKLQEEWGDKEFHRMIAILDEGIELKGYVYKSHALALRSWKKKEGTFQKPVKQDNFKTGGINFEL